MERGQLKIQQDEAEYSLDLDAAHEGVRREDVIRALDRRVKRDDVLQADMIAWLGRMLDGLLAREIELTHVARHLNQLAETIADRLSGLARQGRHAAFQRALFTDSGNARLSDHFVFRFDPNIYPARWSFAGRYVFSKHFYPLPGELQEELAKEETACAIEIDSLPEVEFWVRNLERQLMSSFWLPTSTDRFYPDFVVQLKDGRVLVVEYKGAHLFNNDDSKEKRDIGKVWAAASKGRCLFAMITDAAVAGRPVSAQLREALSP